MFPTVNICLLNHPIHTKAPIIVVLIKTDKKDFIPPQMNSKPRIHIIEKDLTRSIKDRIVLNFPKIGGLSLFMLSGVKIKMIATLCFINKKCSKIIKYLWMTIKNRDIHYRQIKILFAQPKHKNLTRSPVLWTYVWIETASIQICLMKGKIK